MYKRIDFTQLEGFGLTQDDFEFMQSSYREAVSAMAGLLGDLVIVSGVQLSGGNYTNGWVAINGELLPFVGGLVASNIIIEETTNTNLFEDGNEKVVYYTRVAKLANSGGNAFSSFVRLDTLKQMKQNITNAQNSANSAEEIATDAAASANNRVLKTGDTMTGPLVIPSGTQSGHAVNKSQLDAKVNAGVAGSDPNAVPLNSSYSIMAGQGNNFPAAGANFICITAATSQVAVQISGTGAGDIYVRGNNGSSWNSWLLGNS
ncbi:pyocin knob domain-containing protein [Chryseosolibacter indicus]|uniref:Uncharacterized protein n=1 Tax=Chryseosolibacter indicus TaxID=2782351 RepID=A0ABS5VPL6_9BACT|nr:pyocin knob domain-containing protein [Chryseosolibacter indicus]MBT1702968.1 hypothetical protein [Chryseosolibacter indicus]